MLHIGKPGILQVKAIYLDLSKALLKATALKKKMYFTILEALEHHTSVE